jgi:hypothetical protein
MRNSKHESSDTFCWLVHSVRALLARGVAGAGTFSHRVAGVIAIAAYRHHVQRAIRPDQRCAVSSSAFAWLAEMRMMAA